MRIAGLASGMDIDSIVKDLMKVERMPLDKLKQKKQILEWQRDDYRSLNTKLLSFRDKLSQLKLTTNYRARSVSSSNEQYVTATVTNGAAQASYSISKVEQLAKAATLVSTDKINIDPNSKLHSVMPASEWKTGVLESQTFTVSDPEESLKINLNGSSFPQNVTEINIKVNGLAHKARIDDSANPDANEIVVRSDGTIVFGEDIAIAKDTVVKVDYVLQEKTQTKMVEKDSSLTTWSVGKSSINQQSFTLSVNGVKYQVAGADGKLVNIEDSSDSIGTINLDTGVITFEPKLEVEKEGDPIEIKATYAQNYSSFGIQSFTSKGEVNETIFYTSSETLSNITRKVNDSSAGLTMFYDSFSGKVTMTRKETGKFNQEDGVDFSLSGNLMLDILNFDNSQIEDGQNAKFIINGLETERNSNTFDMNGVTFTLKQIFSESDNVQPTSITVSNDTQQVLDNIKEFVDQYNELIKEISGKLNEKRYRDYKPLTDDEREELSEKQQEKWEEMARSGLLKGDSVLSSVLSQMRMDMYSTVETNGLFKQLSSIGIKTTANYLEGGKLEIDEAKLKEALEQDPDAIENLFRGNDSESGKGIVHRLYDTVDASMKKIQEKAGRASSTNQQFTIGRELINVNDSIDRFEDRLKMIEARYWRQFTAMETAINKANSQSTYLMQQFGGY